MSQRLSRIALPVSSVSSRAIASRSRSIRPATRSSSAARSLVGIRSIIGGNGAATGTWRWCVPTIARSSAPAKKPRWLRSPIDSTRKTLSRTLAQRYHGRSARLHVAETEVILHRPGKRNVGKKKIEIPGPPLPLRLVVTEIRDSKGRVLARWLLLTNVPAALGDTATIARWYYFRWRIETYHKLLKGAGWQMEGWLQRDGQGLLVKLMLALGPARQSGAGTAPRRRSGGLQEAVDAIERPPDETESRSYNQRSVGWTMGSAMCGRPARSPRPRRTQRHVRELLARICKEQWTLILL